MKKYTSLIFIGIAFLSCSKDDSNEGFFVLYNQTYCSDPWGYAEDNNKLATKIKSYFKSENIEIFNLNFDNKGISEDCFACSCISGKRIIAKINKNDLDHFKEYGFQEYEQNKVSLYNQ